MARSTTRRKSVKAESKVEAPAAEAPVVETPATPAEPVAPPAPALHLLPFSIARLAEHADVKGSASRFALNGVMVEFGSDNTFKATATDTKQLVHVEGQCVAPPDEYPASCIPALAHSPNGASKALIPSSFWRESFQKAKKLTRKAHQTALKSVAVVAGDKTTTMAATDIDSATCDTTLNLEGRFAPYEDIIRKANRDGDRVLKVAVDPKLLISVLATIADFNDEDSIRAELVFRFSDPEPEGDNVEKPAEIVIEKPFLVQAQNQTSKLTGLVMPLA